MAKVYDVKKIGDKYFVMGQLGPNLRPRYMAVSPRDGELFLLCRDGRKYALLKGNLAEGMSFCETDKPFRIDGDSLFDFRHDDIGGLFVSPLRRNWQPKCQYGLHERSHELEKVSFAIVPAEDGNRRRI